jgi:SAM-dependent methyltransferase
MGDPFGKAIYDYFEKGKADDLLVNSNYTEDEQIPADYFFRTEKKMPEIEKAALKRCKGRVLDVGAAAGCHSVILQKKGYSVTALEKSPLAAEVLKKRGIQKVVCSDVRNFSEDTFDTILLLMNGAGIGETVEGLKSLLVHLQTLLRKNGQVLIDSSDIHYLFEEEDGSVWMNLASENYYGEMEYEVRYKKETDHFKWLFIDFELLSDIARQAGFLCRLLETGGHFEYLAQLEIESSVNGTKIGADNV